MHVLHAINLPCLGWVFWWSYDQFLVLSASSISVLDILELLISLNPWSPRSFKIVVINQCIICLYYLLMPATHRFYVSGSFDEVAQASLSGSILIGLVSFNLHIYDQGCSGALQLSQSTSWTHTDAQSICIIKSGLQTMQELFRLQNIMYRQLMSFDCSASWIEDNTSERSCGQIITVDRCWTSRYFDACGILDLLQSSYWCSVYLYYNSGLQTMQWTFQIAEHPDDPNLLQPCINSSTMLGVR